MLTNFHLIEVTFCCPTNCRGSRVRLRSHRFNATKFIPYDYEHHNITDMAHDWLTAKGFRVLGTAETNDGYALLSDTFQSI